MRAVLVALALAVPVACAQQSPMPPPPEEASGEVFGMVEQRPEMIGGMEGLLQRITLPPGAPVAGEVCVTAIVDERGEVAGAYAAECALGKAWCDAAVRAVAGSVFQPASARGRPSMYRFVIPVQFTRPGSAPRFTARELADRATAERVRTAEHPVLIGGRRAAQQRAILPPEAIEHSVRGRVHVSMTVGVDGIARDLTVSRGLWRGVVHTPEQEEAARKIERNALDAAAGLRFEPGTHEGQAIPMHVSLSLDFFPRE